MTPVELRDEARARRSARAAAAAAAAAADLADELRAEQQRQYALRNDAFAHLLPAGAVHANGNGTLSNAPNANGGGDDDDFVDPFLVAARQAALARLDDADDVLLPAAKRARTDDEIAGDDAALDVVVDDADNPYKMMLVDTAVKSEQPRSTALDEPSADDDVDTFAAAFVKRDENAASARAVPAAPTVRRHELSWRTRDNARILYEDVAHVDTGADDDNAEDEAKRDALIGSPFEAPTYRMRVCDALTNTGPVLDIALGRSGGTSAEYAAEDAAAADDDDDDEDDVEWQHGSDADRAKATAARQARKAARVEANAQRTLPHEQRPGEAIAQRRASASASLSVRREEQRREQEELSSAHTNRLAEIAALKATHERADDARRKIVSQRWQQLRNELRDETAKKEREHDRHYTGRDRERVRREDTSAQLAIERERERALVRELDVEGRVYRDADNAEMTALLKRLDADDGARKARFELAREARVAAADAERRAESERERARLVGDERLAGARVELVACAGSEARGALALLQRSVRARVLSSARASTRAINALWSVGGSASAPPLLVARTVTGGTLVYEHGDFTLDTRQYDVRRDRATIAVATLFGGAKLCQVHSGGLRLLDGHSLVQEVTLDAHEAPVVAAAAADPHVVLLLADGTLVLHTCRADVQMLALTARVPALASQPDARITALSVFESVSSHRAGVRSPFDTLDASEQRGATGGNATSSAHSVSAAAAAAAAVAVTAANTASMSDGKSKSKSVPAMTDEEEELALFGTRVTAPTNVKHEHEPATANASVRVDADEPASRRWATRVRK
jgi:hypothetical protein